MQVKTLRDALDSVLKAPVFTPGGGMKEEAHPEPCYSGTLSRRPLTLLGPPGTHECKITTLISGTHGTMNSIEHIRMAP